MNDRFVRIAVFRARWFLDAWPRKVAKGSKEPRATASHQTGFYSCSRPLPAQSGRDRYRRSRPTAFAGRAASSHSVSTERV